MAMMKTGQPVPAGVVGQGLLVVVEGMDGAGKSTLVDKLVPALRERGLLVNQTREPTRDGKFGKLICESREERYSPLEEYWLFMLDRAEHARRVIRPSLARGEIVITDRYYHSTIVYQALRMPNQGGVYGLRQRIWFEATQICPVPDLLMVMDLPPEVAYERIQSGRKADAFETPEQLTQYRQAYLDMVDGPYTNTPMPGRVVLDATKTQDELVVEAVDWIERTKRGLAELRQATL